MEAAGTFAEGQPGRGARRGRHLLGVLVLVRRGAHPRRALTHLALISAAFNLDRALGA
jgi:hypothetical protein